MHTWPESLHTVMQQKMKHGDSIHPHGLQLLAVRLLKVCLHNDTWISVTLCFVCTTLCV